MKPIPPSSDRVRTPIVVALVAAIHLLAFGGFSLLQGCATRAPRTGSNSSTAIASSRGTMPRTAPEPAAPATRAPAPSAPAPAARAPAASPMAGVIPMPPREAGRGAATPAPTPDAPVASGLKTFTPPPFVPTAGQVKTPATPRVSASATPSATAGGQKYVVQPGESLSLIAQKHGVKTRELMELNGLADANRVRVGQTLLVPANAKTPAGGVKAPVDASAAPAVKTPATTPLLNAGGGGIYKVKSGDALSKIAKQFGTTTAELRKLNHLSSDMVRVDQTLKLPGTAAAPAASLAVMDVGTKVPATTPSPVLAQSDVEAILGHDPARRATTGTTAKVDEVLEAEIPEIIPAPRDTVGTGGITLKPTEYKILPGDTVGKLAVIFLSSEAEIRRLNGLGPSQEVKAGDTILIPPPKDP